MKSLLIAILMLGVWCGTAAYGEFFQDTAWRNISKEIVKVNTVWVDRQNQKMIIIGTDRGVFETKDGGDSWQAVLFGANKKVNFLYVDQSNKNLIYAGCGNGLFFSHNQGRTWQRIYQCDSEQKVNCLGILELKTKAIYLGTQAGLVMSQNNGRTWHKLGGRLGNLSIRAISEDKINKLIYLVASDGVYQIDRQNEAKRIFVSLPTDSQDIEDIYTDSEDIDFSEDSYQINHICIDPNKPQHVYLATGWGVFISINQGLTWRRLPDFGLLSQEIRFIKLYSNSVPLVVTKSGVFAYNKDSWQELSLRLTMQNIRFLTIDHFGNIYAAGDKGLFKSAGLLKKIIYPLIEINQDLSIQEIQQAAIEYAQIIDPRQICAHRRLARLKAILPDFSLDYDRTISTYSNSSVTRFAVGPNDWGISLKWSLSDLIWSEQQRLIDSQVRLLVKLRQDILDEVTRLYFERRRLQLELESPQESGLKKNERELRIEEITALLDGLTGGYLSRFGLTE
jgi:ligand-binding sensor domain-containing protein